VTAIDRVIWVGHSTVTIDLDGVRLVTDPLLRSRVLHLRRLAPLNHEATQHCDAILISHGHWDHLDIPSLEKLGRSVPVVVPRGLGRLLANRRFAHVTEVAVGEQVEIGALTIRATHAEHDGGRGPLGVRAPSLGYVVTGSRSIYFAGDTDLFAEMAGIGPLDLALLPVGGWGPRLPPGHLDARSAAEALTLLRPKAVIPIHWGTVRVMGARRPRVPATETPAESFAHHAAEVAPEVTVHLLAPGEELRL
jgi:L-ascorbate metabolism protein UlaG (beta-lactamase superfamily)